jgi:hypothetical protein
MKRLIILLLLCGCENSQSDYVLTFNEQLSQACDRHDSDFVDKITVCNPKITRKCFHQDPKDLSCNWK